MTLCQAMQYNRYFYVLIPSHNQNLLLLSEGDLPQVLPSTLGADNVRFDLPPHLHSTIQILSLTNLSNILPVSEHLNDLSLRIIT